MGLAKGGDEGGGGGVGSGPCAEGGKVRPSRLEGNCARRAPAGARPAKNHERSVSATLECRVEKSRQRLIFKPCLHVTADPLTLSSLPRPGLPTALRPTQPCHVDRPASVHHNPRFLLYAVRGAPHPRVPNAQLLNLDTAVPPPWGRHPLILATWWEKYAAGYPFING